MTLKSISTICQTCSQSVYQGYQFRNGAEILISKNILNIHAGILHGCQPSLLSPLLCLTILSLSFMGSMETIVSHILTTRAEQFVKII